MATLSQSAACLRFFGDDLNPDDITDMLGHPPSSGFVKGAVQVFPSGRERVQKSGSWLLKAEDREPADLDAQIEEILSKLTSDLEVWRELKSRFQGDIFFGLFMKVGNEGISISPKIAEMVGNRGLEFDFDIYGPATDD